MPTLNYENAGALVEYDYLQGTITALYPDDDTADVSGVCGTLSKVPIFYHCKPDSAARSNGALTGAAGAFTVGDSAVVLKGINGADVLGQKYYVVGRYDGVKRCSGGDQVLIYASAYGSVWFFVWDMASNNYAEDAYWSVYQSGIKNLITKDQYPFDTQLQQDIMAYWKGERFASLTVTPTRIVESQKMFVVNSLDFGAGLVKAGDYVYSEYYPWIWSKVKSVAGCMIKTIDLVVQTSIYGRWIISSSLPLYVRSEGWVYDQTPLGLTEDAEGYNAGHYVCPGGVGWTYSGHKDRGGHHYDYIENTSDVLPANSGSYADGSVIYDSVDCNYPPSLYGHAYRFYTGATKYNYIANVLKNFAVSYSRDYFDSFERVINFLGDYLSGGSSSIDVLQTYRTSGILNPLASTNFEYTVYDKYLPLPHTQTKSSDWPSVSGELAVCSDDFCFQFYTYHGYQINTAGQCEKRPSAISPPSTVRSSNLETAICELIRSAGGNTSAVGVTGAYYSAKRTASNTGNDMIAMMNAVRGYPELLTEDPWCMSASIEKINFFVANGVAQHENPDGSPLTYVGMEVICVALDTVPLGDIVAGWMASPLHAEAIMEPSYKVMGWATGTYPPNFTQITFGPGMYNAISETYTTEIIVQYIPIENRGHVKCFVVKMTPEP